MTTSPDGKYYIGRHSTNDLNDNYIGSGTWVREYPNKSELRTERLCFCDTFESLQETEEKFLKEHVGNKTCMNLSRSSKGCLGYKHTNSAKKAISDASKVSNKWMRGLDISDPRVALKISQMSDATRGKKKTEDEKKNMLGRCGKWTRTKKHLVDMSDQRKGKSYESMFGKEKAEQLKEIRRQTQIKRWAKQKELTNAS